MATRTEDIVHLNAITVEPVAMPGASNAGIHLDVMRLDKIDAVISGNKWFKLRYYLDEALRSGKQTLLSFGGAYSNHIVALAAASERLGLQSVGIIRGERPRTLSPTLQEASQLGMLLHFLNRSEFGRIEETAFQDELLRRYDNALIIPMGGAGKEGVEGAATIVDFTDIKQYSHICCALGTGTMANGLLHATRPGQQLVVFPVLKGFASWSPDFASTYPTGSFDIVPGFEFTGYAKHAPDLLRFMNNWYEITGIPTDFVYTGKMFYGIMEQIKAGFFPAGSRILAIHSGGLQGNRSLPPASLIF